MKKVFHVKGDPEEWKKSINEANKLLSQTQSHKVKNVIIGVILVAIVANVLYFLLTHIFK
jgi:hypothetical protein